MSCSCDFDSPEFYNSKIRKARKQYKCEECGFHINPGDKYEHVAGKWGHGVDTIRTCYHCVEARREAMSITGCGCFIHGRLWEDITDALNEMTFEPGQRFYLWRFVAQKALRDKEKVYA
jgi:hypothetical protein